ncbi:MAG: DUF4405 domain-containing protein [Candidatus Eremiobacteraeota bacterium]|nr:DUF4405 domain-containing protein [Candidatus Eremiobacteraeota bacterium]
MRRTALNFLIDCLSLVILFGLVGTGAIIKWILPPGSGGQGRALHGGQGGEHIRQFIGMGRHSWGDIHFVLALLFVVLVFVHIMLHWQWIKCFVSPQTGAASPKAGPAGEDDRCLP